MTGKRATKQPKLLGKRGKIYLVAMAIVECKGKKLLLAKRSDCLLWNFVGGTVDFGENSWETVAREVFEETGIRARQSEFRFLFAQETIRPENDLHAIFLVYKLSLGDFPVLRKNGESLEFGWFRPGKPPKGLTPGTRDALGNLLAGKSRTD
ncbi:MAG: NUDIX hydrolase [archaeon]